ncbi:hypothetical protein BJX63DRAFT_416763 [Aspergillus granulosus]|uniref:Uncharacterized protein n=1 Tax=Aspergillus granulosus TaxID=176169 RepID=A0ABR4GT16_9EURO
MQIWAFMGRSPRPIRGLLQGQAGFVMDYLATVRTTRKRYHGERMIRALGILMGWRSYLTGSKIKP